MTFKIPCCQKENSKFYKQQDRLNQESRGMAFLSYPPADDKRKFSETENVNKNDDR